MMAQPSSAFLHCGKELRAKHYAWFAWHLPLAFKALLTMVARHMTRGYTNV
jgi:hypothetical protein